MNNQTDRFNGLRGENYAYLKLAYAHYDHFQDAIAKHIASYSRDGMRILELGAGTGSTLVPTIVALAGKVAIDALDTSATDLEIALKIAADERITPIVADMFDLLPTLQSSMYDIIYTGWTLHNFTENRRAILFKHIKRILKKGGLFVNGDRFAYDDESHQSKSIQEQLDLYRKHLPAELCKGWSEHIIQDEQWKFTESEQGSYFPNGEFTFRVRNEGVFVAINN